MSTTNVRVASSGGVSKKRNYLLDTCKVFAFMGIVSLHTVPPLSTLPLITNVAARIGVPIFFAVSGYFAYNATPKKLWTRFRNIVVLLLGSLFFYGAISYIGVWSDGPDFWKELLTFDFWIRMVVSNQISAPYHLWFLAALAEVYIVVLAWRVVFKRWIGFCVSGLFVLVFCYAVFDFSEMFTAQQIDAVSRTWLVMGVPAFSLGLILKACSERVKRFPSWSLLALVLLGLLLALLEERTTGFRNFYIGSYLSTFAIFALCIKFPLNEKDGFALICANLGGKPVMHAYVVHLALISWLTPLTASFSYASGTFCGQYMLCLVVVISSLFVGAVLDLLSRGFRKLVATW